MAATGAAQAQSLDALDPLSAAVFDAGKTVPTEWRSAEFGQSDTAKVKIAIAGDRRDARGLPPMRPGEAETFNPRGFDVRVTRDWPAAVRISAGQRDLEVTPYAGVGLTNAGPGAEAGARVGISDRIASRIDDLGLRDGRRFGDAGRWYFFVAASGRSVGLNMLREDGDLRQAGWSVDGASALVSDAQVGVGWRRGAMQASIGYLHREIEPEHPIMGLDTEQDDLIALSFSFKPH